MKSTGTDRYRATSKVNQALHGCLSFISSRARAQYQRLSWPSKAPQRNEIPASFHPGVAPVGSQGSTMPNCPAIAEPAASASTTAYLPGGSERIFIVTVNYPLALEQKNCVSETAVWRLASST